MAMATCPIPGLLTEFVVLGLQAVDQGAQFSHFRAQILHRGGQLGRNLGLLLGMVQKQVTAQGWLMSTPEGDAPDPTLTRWGLAGCRQLDPQPSRSCHSRRSAC
jgi:hypothetical protein